MLYIYTMKQFYSFRQKMHCIKLYYIYFKSICLFTIPLVDASTLLCLEVTSAEETNEHHHLYHLQDHLRQLFQDLDSRSWVCALLAIFLLWHQIVFHFNSLSLLLIIFSSETRNDFHKVIESVSATWRNSAFYFMLLLMMLKWKYTQKVKVILHFKV